MVECQLPKLDVAGSNPVSRSIFSITWETRFKLTPITPFSSRSPRGAWRVLQHPQAKHLQIPCEPLSRRASHIVDSPLPFTLLPMVLEHPDGARLVLKSLTAYSFSFNQGLAHLRRPGVASTPASFDRLACCVGLLMT